MGETLRIVSLLASGTEIVCALGMGDALVGRSHECDNPAWVRELPSLSSPAFDVTVASVEIDREVTRRLRAGEPLYVIDTEQMEALKADLLITQEHCEVCAVTPKDVKLAGCRLPARQVIALKAGTLDGIFDGVMTVARALGLEARGAALVARERARLEALHERCRTKVAPTVVLLEWTEPAFAMGNWGPELVEAAHGRLLLGHRGEHSRAIPWSDVVAADPEYLVIAPCGYDLARALRELPVLERMPGWSELRAVREGRVAFADGNLYFNRSGMTVTRTAEILAEILHGEITGEVSEGSAWQWLR